MKFSCPKMPKLSSRPWPKSGKKKYIVNSAIKSGKYIIAGGLMCTGAEGVSKLINHTAQPSMSDEAKYIVINDWLPSIVKVNRV